ncbi:hypothetical protein DYU05_07715 [Mucilaginibacter terrenus]|uniref:Uncharacterized protein n=1 Tax=Mucilaginibacter terrenus TaxID=2482727 RepID=A0A3E2NWU2_9SPHI|nr:hypothetical protein [Mucilaginibacter terrenus]RFZ85473.1 hypothetical protein DYU05_07715 [Mucilaginibacter terrenus]
MEETPKTPSKVVPTVIAVNLIILVVYTLTFRIIYGADYNHQYGFLLFDAFFIAAHVFVCLVIAIFSRPKEYLLSAVLVLVIGFGTCVIGL